MDELDQSLIHEYMTLRQKQTRIIKRLENVKSYFGHSHLFQSVCYR